MTDVHEAWPERIDPLREPPGVVAHHLKKYEFARRHVAGLVLDIACGIGYGTSFLAPSARKIVGIEIAEEAMQVASHRYLEGNVSFVQADAERLPFSGAIADAITCFEGVEHFGDPEAHLAEVVRVLKPGGVYLVSTPHPDANPHGEENPYHLHAFERERFESMLRARFGDVSMLGQVRLQTRVHRVAQSWDVLGLRRSKLLRPLTKWISRAVLNTAPLDDATLEDFAIRPYDQSVLEYVALCRDPTG